MCFALQGTSKSSKRQRLAEAKEERKRGKVLDGQSEKGGGKGGGKGGNKGGKRSGSTDVPVGLQARLVDDTTDLGFIKLGTPASKTFLKIDINKARKILVDDHGFTAERAELMCLPVLCDLWVPARAGYCQCAGEVGHESAQSKYHHFVGLEIFKEKIKELFAWGRGGSRE